MLACTISATGRASLKLGSSTVKRLEAGVYKLSVSDHSKKAGLVIQALGYHAMTESAPSGTGTKTTTLEGDPCEVFLRGHGRPEDVLRGHELGLDPDPTLAQAMPS